MDRVEEYIESLFRQEQIPGREEFIDRTEWKDFVPVVDSDVARFLRVLLRIKKPMRILELGTSIGYSAANMALAAREYGGSIVTVEYDPKAAAQARQNFRRTGVDPVVEIREGDALEVLPSFADGSFGLVFLDLDKRLYPRLLPECVRVLSPGGVLLADDALFPVMDLEEEWRDLVPPMEEFNRLVSAAPELEGTLLPIGDGLIVAAKKDEERSSL